jgi:hypothetical protein
LVNPIAGGTFFRPAGIEAWRRTTFTVYAISADSSWRLNEDISLPGGSHLGRFLFVLAVSA